MAGFRSGFIAIIGRPNVGKSTLINSLIGEKVVIVSDKPQTTRNRIQCVLTRENCQYIFIDTPGLHKPKTKLGEYMVSTARKALEDMDAVLFVVDAADGIGSGDRHIADLLKTVTVPVILAVNKMDIANLEPARKAVDEFVKDYSFSEIIEISAATGYNLRLLEDKLYTYLPEGPKYYPDDMITDQPERVIIAEIIREKALQLLKEEVPHGIGVEIESISERPDKAITDVHAVIICERTSHKGIVIGKGGRMLKDIGSLARQDIERLLGTKVYLELFVKVKEDWRNDQSMLRSLGYDKRNL
ncbi:MAG TPA: GTPase Era [Candidatus Atribacteria bacterium]|nr:GTPase Era [Candidatus Atribacteria bacterium]HPT78852.1 GTPase Era [Candidatus Atribacteria bacterium]